MSARLPTEEEIAEWEKDLHVGMQPGLNGCARLLYAARRERRLREALEKIAEYDDAAANEHLAKTGSYGRFDEPGSVHLARAALAPGGGEE